MNLARSNALPMIACNWYHFQLLTKGLLAPNLKREGSFLQRKALSFGPKLLKLQGASFF